MPPSKRLRCDDPEWARRKTAIEMMYVVDRLSQKKIRDELKEDGFLVTKSELEAQLHFWNIRKNASADVWRYTDHRLMKREQQGKASVVYYNRKKVSCNTLKKERSRYQPDTLTKYMTAVSPKTPEGMELWIRTPTPAPVQLMWAHTLPWIQFQDKALPSILSYMTNRIIDHEPRYPGSQTRLNFSPLHRHFDGGPFMSASDFAVNVTSMMPEEADNEIANGAQLIVQGAINQALNEHIKLVLYCLSNNMYKIDFEDETSWLAVVNLIDSSGLTKQPLGLAQEKELTVKSIAEKLFQLCLEFMHLHSSWSRERSSNSNVIIWLLESGQNPDVGVNIDIDGDIFSPLQLATIALDFKLANKLLDVGADPNKSLGCNYSPLLGLLRDENGVYWKMTPKRRNIFKNLVLRLLKAGASLNEGPSDEGPSALMLAVRLDLQIADILIQHGSKIDHQTESAHITFSGYDFIRTQSVMGFAICDSDEKQAMRKIRHLIGHLRQSNSSISSVELLPADVIYLAAFYGFKEVIEYWCGSQNDTGTRQYALFSALCAASFSGCRETCELLLQHGASIKGPEGLQAIPLPIHFAAIMDRSAVIELLCEHGADVNAEFEAKWANDQAEYYMWERATKGYDMLNMDSLYVNPLGAALLGACRTLQSFEILIQRGAKLPIWAVYYGADKPHHPEIACSAVEQGGNLNWRGPDGRTPLQRALRRFTMSKFALHDRKQYFFDKNAFLAVINSLVDAGAETAGSEAELIVLLEHWSPPDEVSIRALHNDSQFKACNLSILAASFLTRSITRIERALARCLSAYDPDALCAGVMFAISSGSTGPLQQLIDNRPEGMDATEQEGIALGIAAWHSRLDILDMLLSKMQSSTPALIPVYSHHPDIWMPIPSKGYLQANISKSFEEEFPFWYRECGSENGFLRGSPLIFSIWSQECLDKLLENNFHPDRLTLCVAVLHGNVEIVEKLLHRKWDIDNDVHRPGPLWCSVSSRLGTMTRTLLNAGLSPNESNKFVSNGRSPLQKAVEDGNLEMIDLLLEFGADVNAPAAKYCGATALQFAAIQGRLGIARRLIDLGANVNASEAEIGGWTALEGAAKHGRLDMVQLLLDRGASVVGDGCLQYFKAIRIAEVEAHMVVAKLLKSHREWTSLDHETWKAFIALEDWRRLKVLDRLSMEEPIASDTEARGPENTVRLDMHSDDDVRQKESIGGGSIGPKEAACVEKAPARFRTSWAAMSAGIGHDHMIVEHHSSSHIYDDTTWNQQLGNPEGRSQTSWDDKPKEAVHDIHYMQGFQIPGVNDQIEWNRQPASTNQDVQAAWESMLIEVFNNDVRMEGQLSSAESAWDTQLRATDWNDPQNSLSVEMESGICYEIFDGDMDWFDAQDTGNI